MNRLLSILVTLFILFLVYLWINHLTSDNTGTAEPEVKQSPVSQPGLESPDDVYRAPEEDSQDSGQSAEPVGDDADEQQDAAPPPADPPKEKPKVTESKPKAPVKTPPARDPVKPVSRSTDAAAGMHLVIAGNFLEKANAEERVKQLKKLGYAQAEVVNFELSEYHTACAGRYSDLNEARRISRKIKEMHSIDTYVRLGN